MAALAILRRVISAPPTTTTAGTPDSDVLRPLVLLLAEFAVELYLEDCAAGHIPQQRE